MLDDVSRVVDNCAYDGVEAVFADWIAFDVEVSYGLVVLEAAAERHRACWIDSVVVDVQLLQRVVC